MQAQWIALAGSVATGSTAFEKAEETVAVSAAMAAKLEAEVRVVDVAESATAPTAPVDVGATATAIQISAADLVAVRERRGAAGAQGV